MRASRNYTPRRCGLLTCVPVPPWSWLHWPADGTSEVDETIHIERGYENIVEKLQALGADIRRVEIPANAVSRAM